VLFDRPIPISSGSLREENLAIPSSTIVREKESDSILTLAAIGIVAYISCDLLHELIGHGGICFATGGRPITFSSFHFQCFGGWQPGVSAAGIVFNILAGGALWLVARRNSSVSIHFRYFVWVAMAYNFFTAWGYVVSSSLSNSGDLANAMHSAPPAWHWRVISATLGAVFYILCTRVAASQMRPLIGPGYSARLWRLILIPYFASALVSCAAGALNHIMGVRLAINAAISTTLGSWGFLLLPLLLLSSRNTPAPAAPPIPRSFGWIIAAVLAAAVFVGVMGPGVSLR
jgi:hypothetical protein